MDRRAFNTALLSAAATSVLDQARLRLEGVRCFIKASGID